MASTFSSNIGLEEPALGDYVNTWNTPVNANWTLIDQKFGSVGAVAVTGGTTTLTVAQAAYATLKFTGVLTSNQTVILPAATSGLYQIWNATTGAFTLTIKAVGGDTGVAIPQTSYMMVFSDATNARASNNSASIVSQLGYTPANRGGDTFTGGVTFSSTASFSSTSTFNGVATFVVAPVVPTATAGTSTTAAASTAFVQTAIGPTPSIPAGRLTLTTAVPVLSATVSAATTIYYTPYQGSVIPLWNGSMFLNTAFAEVSQLLSDTTKSPAAAVAASCYDMFVWNDAGTVRLSRGPVWTNVTTRSAGTAIARVSGILVNSIAITNGPGAGAGTYVGTIATDAGGATVTFTPQPAAASGGPTVGAWVGLWNQYNRVAVAAIAQDSKASWTYSTSTWRGADNAPTKNRVVFVTGNAEDAVLATYSVVTTTQQGASNTLVDIGIALDAVGTPTIASSGGIGVASGIVAAGSTISYSGPPLLGQHIVIAEEWSGNATGTFYGQTPGSGAQSMQLSAQLMF